jgi:succinylglutamate desuccinylase
LERLIGWLTSREPGATVVAVAGMHGNEAAGIHAASRVLREAQLERGDFLVLAGNLKALERRVRYVDFDLNRAWSEGRAFTGASEDLELEELTAELEKAAGEARGPRYLIDLHTTSAPGIPFLLFGNTAAQSEFVGAFPIPVIFNLEEQVGGILTRHWTQRGFVTCACEGGQHEDPATVENLEAVLWIALEKAGLLKAPEKHRALLDERRQGVPRTLEVLSRRAISPADGFVMEPGFRNIEPVVKDQLLARDRRGEIRAPHDGVVIMPLYQGQGGDGFFWGRVLP